jgi:hypothetical protein
VNNADLIKRARQLLAQTTTASIAPAPSVAPSLLEQAGEGVTAVSPDSIVIDPAAENARPIYWERTGTIVGPAIPEFLAKVGEGSKASYWVVAQFEGQSVWINSIMIRSKKEFESQVPLKQIDLVREPR